MYDVADIRAKLAPKRRALQDKKMREKGLIAAGKGARSNSNSNQRAGEGGGGQGSASDLQRETHLPGKLTNPDE